MRHASLPLAAAPAADEELARLIAAGDDGAFDELYRRYSIPLARYAGRILRDPVAGEDVAQTALLHAYQALRRGSTPEHFRSWAYRIARNAALEVIERRGDVVPLLDGDGTGCEDALDVHAQRADLIAALRTLPERQRAVYVLRELQGLRVGEIGSRLGLATEQVEQAMFAARNRLAEHLEFGERLDCASVRSLTEARLTRAQRRAVKSHLRSCAACRVEAPLRVGALTLPAALFDALRAGAAALFGGGSAAPLAAKAAAVVVVATAAGAAPVLVDRAEPSTAGVESASAPSPSLVPGDAPRALPPVAPFAVPFHVKTSPLPRFAPTPTGNATGAPAPDPVVDAPDLETAPSVEAPASDTEPVETSPDPEPAVERPADEPVRDPEPEREREGLLVDESTFEEPAPEREVSLRDEAVVEPSPEPTANRTNARG